MSRYSGIAWRACCALLFAFSLNASADDAKKIEVTDETFKCLTEMTPVRGFFVANLLGKLDDTLKVANSASGGRYPPGSVIQLVPTEVMVKHREGFESCYERLGVLRARGFSKRQQDQGSRRDRSRESLRRQLLRLPRCREAAMGSDLRAGSRLQTPADSHGNHRRHPEGRPALQGAGSRASLADSHQLVVTPSYVVIVTS